MRVLLKARSSQIQVASELLPRRASSHSSFCPIQSRVRHLQVDQWATGAPVGHSPALSLTPRQQEAHLLGLLHS